ncbi:MAG: hypothetical protein WCD79_23285 [Chthoniobacteraceae bacterium]
MKCARPLVLLRAAGLSLLMTALAVAWPLISARAEDPAPEKKETATKKVMLSPEVEAKFTKFLNKTRDAKAKVWAAQMKSRIEKIGKATGLTPEQAQALEAPAEQAADACMDGWVAKIRDVFQPTLNQQGEQAVQWLDQVIPQAGVYAKNDMFGDYARPADNTLWTDAMRRVLSPEQAATWEKVQAEEKRVREEKIVDFLKTPSERTRDQYEKMMLVKSAYIQRALSLPKERADQLDALAKTEAGKAIGNWEKHADKMLLSVDEDQFNQTIKSGNFYLGSDAKDAASEQEAWKAGVAKILSADESKQLEAFREAIKSKRVHMLGQIMLALLDEKIAFTASQRQQLQPVVERMVKDQQWASPENEAEFENLNPQMLYAAGSPVTEQELKPILDDIQWKHWQEVCTPKVPEPEPPKTDGEISRTSNSTDEEQVEHEISDFLYEKTIGQRKKLIDASVLKAEDAARVAGLGAEVTGRLQTAARGAAEEALNTWKSFIDQIVRSQLQNTTADNVKQRLANIQSYYFQQGGNNQPVKNAFWEKAVSTELNAEQRAAWQKEVDARGQFRDQAVAGLIIGEFARKHMLTLEQTTKLEPMITSIVKDYSAEISSMFSSNNSTPWYLQYYMMFMPFAGISEKDLKDILTKEQWNSWSGSMECANSSQFWSNIKAMHAQKVRNVN